MGIDREKLDLIKRTVAKGASDDEFELFMTQARRLKLDPLSRQIFLVPRWDKTRGATYQTMISIDGMRLVAQRTGKYRGQTPTEWCGNDGAWKDVWLSNKPPAASRVGILHADFDQPLYAVARFEAYAQRKKDQSLVIMWTKMGDVMIAKCAESLGLRKAFPNELSGIYSEDEMGQANNESPTSIPAKPALAEIVNAQQKQLPPQPPAVTIAQEFERMLTECATISELDQLSKKAPNEDMSEEEKRSARIVYAKRKAAIATEVMAS